MKLRREASGGPAFLPTVWCVNPAQLNPAQSALLSQLGATPGERPEFASELGIELRGFIDDGTEGLLDEYSLSSPGEAALYFNKHTLNQVFGCERRFIGEVDDPFEWSLANARGTVAHKAIELSVNWRGTPEPLDLCDDAIERLGISDKYIADFLNRLSDADRAELRSEVAELVVKFSECFPPLKPAWRPVTESSCRIELHDGRIILSGKVDLTLGQAEGTMAGKVLFDFKTGATSPSHRHDLRFYALLETLRIGTPPRQLVSYYLDQGRLEAEDVSVDLLYSAAARLNDGVSRFLALRHGRREPGVMPGPPCRWCRVLQDCSEGRHHLKARGEPSDWD